MLTMMMVLMPTLTLLLMTLMLMAIAMVVMIAQGPARAEAEIRFQLISEAFQTLNDPVNISLMRAFEKHWWFCFAETLRRSRSLRNVFEECGALASCLLSRRVVILMLRHLVRGELREWRS
uniref:Secreted protein n=1 Tax=Chrysotila carterae TaxID=13221 RepID=A0A7S4BCY5_CHRCT